MKKFCLRTYASQLKTEVSSGILPVAIFDIDSTLLDVTPRNIAILRAAASDPHFIHTFPQEVEKLRGIKSLKPEWGIKQHLCIEGLTNNNQFLLDIKRFWESRFFSNDFLSHDEAYPGAQNYIWTVQKTGAQVIYLTGRDVKRMQDGTIASLKNLNFPFHEDNVQLVMKPEASLDDAVFKLEYLSNQYDSSTKIWLFENEPTNIHLIADNLPNIQIVFFKSVHSGKHGEPAELPHLESWLIDNHTQ